MKLKSTLPLWIFRTSQTMLFWTSNKPNSRFLYDFLLNVAYLPQSVKLKLLETFSYEATTYYLKRSWGIKKIQKLCVFANFQTKNKPIALKETEMQLITVFCYDKFMQNLQHGFCTKLVPTFLCWQIFIFYTKNFDKKSCLFKNVFGEKFSIIQLFESKSHFRK